MTVDLLRAVADNHRAWFIHHGKGVHRFDGLEVILSDRSGSLMFPEDATSEQLDAAMGLGLERMSCWSLTDDEALGARLLARGFEWGWQPWWMARDLSEPVDRPAHEVLADNDLHLTTNEGGHVVVHPWQQIAGIFDMGVPEAKRRRGLGLALTQGALILARELGCTWATLNATPMGDPVYRRAGFFRTGTGQTWWLHPGPRPTREQTRLVEAVGLGELDAIAGDLGQWIPGARTPLAVAVDTGRADSAERILALAPELLDRPVAEGGATLLHRAVERGQEPIVRLALSLGADLTVRDTEFKGTPRDWALHLGEPELATLLG